MEHESPLAMWFQNTKIWKLHGSASNDHFVVIFIVQVRKAKLKIQVTCQGLCPLNLSSHTCPMPWPPELSFACSVILKVELKLSRVAHVCNPVYLGGRDWQDHGLKPAQAKS
jgi:hypothetical protein